MRFIAGLAVAIAAIGCRGDDGGSPNFPVDEQNGVLYAAYYNGGIRAFDVRGDSGVRFEAGNVYASDMLRGLWKFKALTR